MYHVILGFADGMLFDTVHYLGLMLHPYYCDGVSDISRSVKVQRRFPVPLPGPHAGCTAFSHRLKYLSEIRATQAWICLQRAWLVCDVRRLAVDITSHVPDKFSGGSCFGVL